MGSEKPKVSGYVSKEIYACFKSFQEKRSPNSASAALGIILSEYFGVDQKVDRQSSLLLTDNFVSKDRFEALENKLSELNSSLLSELDKLVEQRFSSLHSELLNSLPKHIEAEAISVKSSLVNDLLDEPLDELPSKLLSEPLIEGEAILVEDELPSEPSDESPHLQLKIIDPVLEREDVKTEKLIPESISLYSDFTLSESFNPIQTKLLAKRLNIASTVISHSKKNMDEQKFYGWLKKKDPDKISWRPDSGDLKARAKGWVPAEDTPSELLSRLKEWLVANP